MKPEEIYQLRIDRGLSQRDLAILMSKSLQFEISPTTISKWENGKNKPSPAYLKALNETLVYKEDGGEYSNTIRDRLGIDDKRQISGKWYTEWSYINNNNEIVIPNNLEIVSYGDILRGESITQNFSYEIIGYLLKDGIITGHWYSILNESMHHGVFMIKLFRSGKKGTGNWIGTSDNDAKENFKYGKWFWEKS